MSGLFCFFDWIIASSVFVSNCNFLYLSSSNHMIIENANNMLTQNLVKKTVSYR
jgi:hypothetical protein